jgi:plastocyanin
VVALALATFACGNPAPPGVEGTGFTITILGNTFSPQRLEVPPDTTVILQNFDPYQHTVTSAASAGNFTFGGVNGVEFDTPPFTGIYPLYIPPSAPVGTVVPYFCRLHAGAMLNQGEIAVVASTPSE